MPKSKLVSDISAEQVPALRVLVQSLSRYYLASEQAVLPSWLQATLTDDAFHRRLQDPRFFHRIILVDDELAGYIALHTGDTPEVYHLYHLFVDARFQRQGLAALLWQCARDELGFEQCTLRSSLFAVPVYERFGFEKTSAVLEKDGLQFQPMALSQP